MHAAIPVPDGGMLETLTHFSPAPVPVPVGVRVLCLCLGLGLGVDPLCISAILDLSWGQVQGQQDMI
jgi:hypothetical protein